MKILFSFIPFLTFSFFVSAQTQDLSKLSFPELDSLMYLEYDNGNYEKAIPYMQAARENARLKFGEQDSVYASYTDIVAFFYDKIGDYQKAEPLYLLSIKLTAKVLGTMHPDYALSLNNLGSLYQNMGYYEKAEPLFLQAKTIQAKVLGETDLDFANTLNNLAILYARTNNHRKAEPLLLQAKDIQAKVLGENHPLFAASVNDLASLYFEMGEDVEAEKLYLQAKEIQAKTLGESHPEFAKSLSNLAVLYQQNKEYKKAEPLLLKANKIQAQALGESHPEFAISLHNLAVLYQAIGDYDKALPLFHRAIAIYKKALGKEYPDLVPVFNGLVSLYQKTENLDSALYYCLQGFDANCAEIDSNFLRQYAFQDMVKILDKNNYYSSAYVNSSFRMLSNTIQAQYAKTKDKTTLENCYELSKSAIRYNERIRNNFTSEEDKLRITAENTIFVRNGIQNAVLLENDIYKAEAFSFAELNKSILLADAVKGNRARVLGDLPDSLIALEIDLQKQFAMLKKQDYEAQTPEAKEQSNKALSKLNFEIDAFLKSIKNKYPKYHALKYENITAKAADIQSLLDEKTALLEYFLTDSTTYLFVVTKTKIELHALPISAEKLSVQVQFLRNALSNYAFIVENEKEAYRQYTFSAHWFYKEMIAKGLTNKTIENLIIVTDGELGHLPFETFLVESSDQKIRYKELHYLVNDYNISYNYSATLWKENIAAEKPVNNGKMLACAAAYPDPISWTQTSTSNLEKLRLPYFVELRKILQPLNAAQKEIVTLSENFQGDFLQNDAANERFFKENASQYSIIHLAMHGILEAQQPMISSLVFTENKDSIEDNFLQAFEISRLKLNADLVVLSACETGYGKFKQGEGIVSLARAFMYAGVPSLVVSLWQVNDHSTAVIMTSFYQYLSDGMSKSEALKKAKWDYIKNTEGIAGHPAFWSPFILMGNTDAITLGRTHVFAPTWIISIVLVVLGLVAFIFWKRKNKSAA